MLVKKNIPEILAFQTADELAYSFAQAMRKERIIQQKSQKDLAELTGLSYSTIVRFETTGGISLPKLMRILKALGKINVLEELIKYDPFKASDTFDEILKREKQATKKRVKKSAKNV